MEFIREKIKEKPINKRRIAMKMGIAALCGVTFAVTACLILLIASPLIKSSWNDNSSQVGTSTEDDTEKLEVSEGTEENENAVIIPPDFNLSINDYQTLQDELYRIGNDVNKSIVVVTKMENENDWMTNDFATEGQSAGIIISQDSNYLYILTERKNILEAAHIRVSFVDGTGAAGTMLKYDANTGLAVLTVEKRQLKTATKNAISVAKFVGTNHVSNGSIVMALGSPLGTNYSILTGNITSTENRVITQDKNYAVFTTDIIGNKNGSGVLVNTNGEVVGIVMQSFLESQDTSTLTAVAYTEVKTLVDKLRNGKDVPYVGLYIATVTEDISKDYDIPKGVYIREVAMDSPAMKAGLQSGDVITKINGYSILTDVAFSDKIGQLIPGTTCEISVKRQNGDAYYDVTCEVTIGVLE